MSIPTKDSLLANWSTNANTKLVASPSTYGLQASDAAAYTAVHTPFIDAFGALVAARDEGVESSQLVADKDSSKVNLLRYARQIYATVQANISVSNADKIGLGVHVKDVEPSPQPVPGFEPILEIVSVSGRNVRIRLRNPNDPDSKAKPQDVDGIAIFSYVGETAPGETSAYKWEGNTSKMSANVLFPASVAEGAKVWLTALFFNEKKQNGPACAPVGCNLQIGGAMAA